MPVRATIQRLLVRALAGRRGRALRRRAAEARRKLRGEPHRVHYFHQVGDPYSALVAARLEDFVAAYDVELVPHLVSGPDAKASASADVTLPFALRDAAAIAPAYGIPFPADPESPSRERTDRANAILAGCAVGAEFAARAETVSRALFDGAPLPEAGETAMPEAEIAATLAEGDATLRRLGHYLPATFYYGGEWYWGLDRLPYLEARLAGLGLRQPSRSGPVVAHPAGPEPSQGAAPVPLEVFFSFRSPYSYLALMELPGLMARQSVELHLRPVLPMVRRGVPLTPAKGRYILFDVAREAERLGIPFGRVRVPSPMDVEPALAYLAAAGDVERALGFAGAVMRAWCAKGRDITDETLLKRLAREAGLDEGACSHMLESGDWRGPVEANAEALQGLGLWGVPSFRVGQRSTWGRDRLWLVERWVAEESR